MLSMPYGSLLSSCQPDNRSSVFGGFDEQKMKSLGLNEQAALYDILNLQKSLDRNAELPDMSRLSLSSESSSTEGFANFMQESANRDTANRDSVDRNTESIQVRVPTSEHVAEIVGKQGCKIKSLRYSTKTYIQTPAREQEPVFTISGYPQDVERAKRRIEEAAEHFTKIRQGRENNSPITPQLGPNAVVRHVRVPLKYVGLVVGPKGHNIKRIQSETDTYIVTPARDKEPIFDIRGAPDKVAEAENKLQMYIAMRTGGMFDDSDHLVDVDLKKPMLPPKPLDSFSGMQTTFGGSKTWGKPEPNLYNSFSSYGNTSPLEPNLQLNSNTFDPTRIEVDSGYSSPSFDNRKDLQALKMFIDQVQQTMNMNNQHASTSFNSNSSQQFFPNRWSHSNPGVF